jgi:hypothetical protein
MKNSNRLSTLLCHPIENNFIVLYNNLTIKEDINKFPDIIFYFNNSNCFGEFNRKTNRFYYSHYILREILKLNYSYNFRLTNFVLDFLIRKYFKLSINIATVCSYSNYNHDYIKIHFKYSLSD